MGRNSLILQTRCPAYLIAAVGSNAGKTSITLGIVRALRRRGLTIQPFKCGPDYLDPTHLCMAAGRSCYNLDSWMMGETHVQSLFAKKVQTADIVIVEGAMGLYDGIGATEEAGTAAHISRLLDIPILLVLDISGMGRSAAAVVHGCCSFDDNIRIAGVIGNRCGSENHKKLVEESLLAAHLPPLLGAIGKDAIPMLPSRHLGLAPSEENSNTQQSIDTISNVIEQQIDLSSLFTTNLHGESSSTDPHTNSFLGSTDTTAKPILTIAVAQDSAFQFVYKDNLEAFEQSGAKLIYFSPLCDDALPKADALYLPGGFPELHITQLAQNVSLRQDIYAFHNAHRPIYAECGGLMFLGQYIVDENGTKYPMCGVLPIQTRLCAKRKALAYSEITLQETCHWGNRGDKRKGHRFHYSEIIDQRFEQENWSLAYSVQHPHSGEIVHEGYKKYNTLASYVHLHWASTPDAAASFVDYCRKTQ